MKAVVIGSGIGGMASAIRLASLGFETDVFEQNPFYGGKINSKKIGSYRFDRGPSVFTEPHLVDELLDISKGTKIHFDCHKLDVSCCYFFEDGKRLALPVGKEAVAACLSKELGEDQDHIKKLLNRLELNYKAVYPVFIKVSLHRLKQWLNINVFKAIARIPFYGLFSSMNTVNRKNFENPKTTQIFNRFATYNGSSPFKSPGMFNIISHLELNIGPYMPIGGMVSISDAVYQKAIDMGVRFHFNTRVAQILYSSGRVNGVALSNKEIPCDLVTSNMDVHFTYEKLLPGLKGPIKILNQEKSTSAIVFYWGIKKSFEKLDVHNIFFSKAYESEFDHLFNKKTLIDDPTVYVHISSKLERSDAPEGCENWFVMVNAPIDSGQDWESQKQKLRLNVLKKLNRILKEDLETLIEVEENIDPIMMEHMYSGKNGSIYGNASNTMMSSFYRHPNFSPIIKGLYFSGVTVHPGGGIPLALNSAAIVEKCVRRDFSIS
ncbi:MAG: phytoene desaturase family protein [Crocinitomicaceae bacterium]|tara:strand:- start:1224 stop:2696 length:1473 start_codon:yes stop_codon:yes gene_type:complete